MKILVINNVGYIGGAEAVLMDLLEADTENRYTVVAPEGPLSKRLEEKSVHVFTDTAIGQLGRSEKKVIGLIRFIYMFFVGGWQVSKICRSIGAEVIYANTLRSGVYGFFPALICRKPFLWHIHDIVDSWLWKCMLGVIISVNPKSHVISVSNAVASSGLLSLVPAHKKSVIYNGLNLDTIYNPILLKKHILIENHEVKRILMYGRIIEWKGFHVLLEALSKLSKESREKIHCTIAGDIHSPKYYSSLQTLICENCLESIVSFRDGMDRGEIPTLLFEHDIIIHASIGPDPLPTVVLESMAMEKTVVASRCGGVPEIISDGINGFLSNPGDADDLVKILERLIRDDGKQTNISARRTILERFNIQNKVRAFQQLYLKLGAAKTVDVE